MLVQETTQSFIHVFLRPHLRRINMADLHEHKSIQNVVQARDVELKLLRQNEAKAESFAADAFSLPKSIHRYLRVLWDFTESDFLTFVIPNTAFGILGALAANALTDDPQSSMLEILRHVPVLILFNWTNVLIFDFANQRSPESVAEDRVNKPWRPIPSGNCSSDECRRMMLLAVPLSLFFNYYLGVWQQGAIIHLTTWLYNDLRGMDEIFVREFLISIGYAMFNGASLQIAQGGATTNKQGMAWIGLISAVILTTMQVQDLKDQKGDRSRGRKTIVLFLGERVSRTSIAVFVLCWTLVCAAFWSRGTHLWVAAVPGTPGLVVSLRVLLRRSNAEDRQTWKLWCLWLVCLYILPVLGMRA